jgi:beta-lactamase superfamily II metal-dependent hydrolase
MRFCSARFLGLLIVSTVLVMGCAEKDTSVYEPDVDPPMFSSVGQSGGRVTWTTDEASSCVLRYGTRSGVYSHYGYHVDDGGTDHYVDLIDVESGTYYASIIATDRAGNSSESEETILEVDAVPATENLVYTMVDVGWGDCHFLEFPGGTNVMVDAGFGDGGEYPHLRDVNDFLEARGINELRPSGIDFMIATHAHADHFTGFLDLIGPYSNTTFLAPARPFASLWPEVGGALNTWKVPRDSLSEGQTNETTDLLKWDEDHGIKVKVLSAGAGRFYESGEDDDKINSDSVVLKITYGRVDIMLNGDAEDFVEQRMLKAYGSELDCDVLKVGHHANDDASSEEFLAVATPRLGLISNSMAENDGVFDPTVINLLMKYDVDYYVTDRAYRNAGRYDEPQDGNVTVTTDGETFVVWAWR